MLSVIAPHSLLAKAIMKLVASTECRQLDVPIDLDAAPHLDATHVSYAKTLEGRDALCARETAFDRQFASLFPKVRETSEFVLAPTVSSHAKTVAGQQAANDRLDQAAKEQRARASPAYRVRSPSESLLAPTMSSRAKKVAARRPSPCCRVEATDDTRQRSQRPRVHQTSDAVLGSTVASRARDAEARARRAALESRRRPMTLWR